MSTQSQSGTRSWLIVVIAVLIAGLALVAGSFLSRATRGSQEVTTESVTDYRIVATIQPLAMIANEVVGDLVHVDTIVPAGATPHGFEPTVSDVATAQQADLVLAVGGEFDAWILTAANADALLIELLAVAEEGGHIHEEEHASEEDHEDGDTDESEEDHENEEDHEHDAHDHEDPHVWLDPHVAGHFALAMAERLAVELPEYAPQFRENANAFAMETEELEEELKTRIIESEAAQEQQISVITMHDAYEPFADAFGFTIAGSYEPQPGETPSPSDIAELKRLVDEQSVLFFATEPQLASVDASVAQQIACDLGVYLITFDPLGTTEQSYVQLLTSNIETLTIQPFEGPEFSCVGR